MKKINISPWVQRFSEIYLKKYKSTKKIKVLDLACGSGRHSRYFIKKKLSVFSVDKNISGIRDLQTRSNISIIEADIEKTDPWSHPSALKGKKLSSEHKIKISNSHKGIKKPWVIERNKSEEQRKAVSCKKPGTALAMIGNKNHHHHIKVTCPHCQKEGAAIIMQRWHFDNCKSKI